MGRSSEPFVGRDPAHERLLTERDVQRTASLLPGDQGCPQRRPQRLQVRQISAAFACRPTNCLEPWRNSMPVTSMPTTRRTSLPVYTTTSFEQGCEESTLLTPESPSRMSPRSWDWVQRTIRSTWWPRPFGMEESMPPSITTSSTCRASKWPTSTRRRNLRKRSMPELPSALTYTTR